MQELKMITDEIKTAAKLFIETSRKYILLTSIINLIFCMQIFTQSISVSGKVTSNRFPVKFATVTFIDDGDTSKKYISYTDGTGNYRIDNITSIEGELNNIPSKFELAQNYPNPFSSVTAILYNLKEQSDIKITIYDILGREVRHFTVSNQTAGIHNILWDGKNVVGRNVASGVYLYKLESNGESFVKKMILNQNGNVPVNLPNLHSQNFSTSFKKTIDFIEEGTSFTIKINNTHESIPFIVPRELENVIIKNDTSINFAVSSMSLSTINTDSTHQIIQGFGAASPWYLPVMTDLEVESAFGMADGQIGFTIFRLTIHEDPNLWANWLPSAQKAYEKGARIIAVPWYAPPHMIERVENRNKIKQDMYDDYAEHLNSFIKYMSDNGAPIFGVSIQNEPDISESWTWWEPEDMLRFMRDFAHLVEGALVMAPESFQFRRNMSDPILNNSSACANTDIVCGHIYGGGLFSYPLAEEKGKEVWMTEYLIGDRNSGNNLEKSIETAVNVNDVMKANMSAYVWWTLVRYYGPIGDGQTAADPEDPREKYPEKGEVTKKGFMLSQFSKFIRPGFFRINSDIYPPASQISVTAYKDPSTSKVVIVAINSGSNPEEQAFRFENDPIISAFSTYTTSELKNCEQGDQVEVVDGAFIYSLEPQSITTFVTD